MSDGELPCKVTVHPCNPQFAIKALRLESFTGKWPSDLPQTAQIMSSAGFFFAGYLDNVKCFFCNGGLCNWETNDEPWTEHARWFPNCGFLKQVKGARYIKKVREVGVTGGPVMFDSKLPCKVTTQLTALTATAEGHFRDSESLMEASLIANDRSEVNVDVKSLKEQNIKLKEQRICKVSVSLLLFCPMVVFRCVCPSIFFKIKENQYL